MGAGCRRLIYVDSSSCCRPRVAFVGAQGGASLLLTSRFAHERFSPPSQGGVRGGGGTRLLLPSPLAHLLTKSPPLRKGGQGGWRHLVWRAHRRRPVSTTYHRQTSKSSRIVQSRVPFLNRAAPSRPPRDWKIPGNRPIVRAKFQSRVPFRCAPIHVPHVTPQLLNSSTPQLLSPQSSVLSPQSSVLSPQSSVLSPQSSVLSPQSSVPLFIKPPRTHFDNPPHFIFFPDPQNWKNPFTTLCTAPDPPTHLPQDPFASHLSCPPCTFASPPILVFLPLASASSISQTDFQQSKRRPADADSESDAAGSLIRDGTHGETGSGQIKSERGDERPDRRRPGRPERRENPRPHRGCSRAHCALWNSSTPTSSPAACPPSIRRRAALAASGVMLERMEVLAANRVSFGLESTLACAFPGAAAA